MRPIEWLMKEALDYLPEGSKAKQDRDAVGEKIEQGLNSVENTVSNWGKNLVNYFSSGSSDDNEDEDQNTEGSNYLKNFLSNRWNGTQMASSDDLGLEGRLNASPEFQNEFLNEWKDKPDESPKGKDGIPLAYRFKWNNDAKNENLSQQEESNKLQLNNEQQDINSKIQSLSEEHGKPQLGWAGKLGLKYDHSEAINNLKKHIITPPSTGNGAVNPNATQQPGAAAPATPSPGATVSKPQAASTTPKAQAAPKPTAPKAPVYDKWNNPDVQKARDEYDKAKAVKPPQGAGASIEQSAPSADTSLGVGSRNLGDQLSGAKPRNIEAPNRQQSQQRLTPRGGFGNIDYSTAGDNT